MKFSLEQVWPRLLRSTIGRLGWLGRLNLSVPVATPRGRVQIPFLAGQAADFAGESWMTELLAALLPALPGTFVDVGVNLGQTVIKVKLVEPARRVIGFEPNPSCVSYLRELVRVNGYANVEILPTGLFVRDAILALDLFSASDVDSAASVIPDFRPGQRVYGRVNVPVVTWRTATQTVAVERLGIVKIDVEGAELDVLTTMEEALARDRPAILIEILPVYHADNQSRLERQEAIERLLRDHRYRIFRVSKTADDRLGSLDEIRSFGVHDDLTRCDYCLLPGESVARFQRALPMRVVPARPDDQPRRP